MAGKAPAHCVFISLTTDGKTPAWYMTYPLGRDRPNRDQLARASLDRCRRTRRIQRQRSSRDAGSVVIPGWQTAETECFPPCAANNDVVRMRGQPCHGYTTPAHPHHRDQRPTVAPAHKETPPPNSPTLQTTRSQQPEDRPDTGSTKRTRACHLQKG